MNGADIVLSDVKIGYGTFAAHFDLTIEGASLTAVIGPSGAGKSTLLNLIAGLESPRTGAIRIAGKDVANLGVSERPVSMLFQENNLFAHLTVETNVGLGLDPGLKLGREGWTAAETALERVGLAGYGKRLPGTLSGGERQRVALARSLVRRRPVLLLDEPFAALGPGLRADMMALVDELRRETEMTVVMVTHTPSDAGAIADRIAFVHEGRAAATGPATGFFQRRDIPGLAAYIGNDDTV